MKVKTQLKVGKIALNHNQSGITVKSKVKAGGVSMNHNQTHSNQIR